MVLRSSHGIHPRYIYQVLRQSEIIETFNVIADSRSGTFPQITFDAIKAMKVVIPSNECINRYIDYVSAIFID
jgi:type I restriction enzyme S subunit